MGGYGGWENLDFGGWGWGWRAGAGPSGLVCV